VGVVRFSRVSDLPVRKSYQLVVELASVPGELKTQDNTRSYEILVHGVE
jgi:hypothetical protein